MNKINPWLLAMFLLVYTTLGPLVIIDVLEWEENRPRPVYKLKSIPAENILYGSGHLTMMKSKVLFIYAYGPNLIFPQKHYIIETEDGLSQGTTDFIHYKVVRIRHKKARLITEGTRDWMNEEQKEKAIWSYAKSKRKPKRVYESNGVTVEDY